MSNPLKYIEILSIEQLDDKYYLQVALHADEVTKVYWQIDEVTYENLYLQCDFTGSERYRLSFKILENSLINKLVGRITRTYLTSSSMIDFQTTKEFKEQIQQIRLHSQMNTLYQLAFIEPNIHGLYADEQEIEAEPLADTAPSSDAVITEVTETPSQLDEEAASTEKAEEPSDHINTAEQSDTAPFKEAEALPDQKTIELEAVNDSDIEMTEQYESTPSIEHDNKLDTVALAVEEEATVQQNTSVAPVVEEPIEQQTDHIDEAAVPVQEIKATADEHIIEEKQPNYMNDTEAAKVAATDSTEPVQPIASLMIPDVTLVMPIQTIMTLPTINQELQHATITRPADEEIEAVNQDEVVASEVPPAEITVTPEAEQLVEAVVEDVANGHEENTEKTNIAAEEEKIAEVQMLASEAASTVEPVDPSVEAINKQPDLEKEAEETHSLSNNMIALIAVAVAIFIAVAIYFAFFQQNANTLNTESAVANETSNAVTYNIEESFTFSLPSEYVALTFNRGPSPYTEQILNILNEYKYGATFFLQGNQVPLYPDLVKSVDANGHSIGHITDSHTLLTILEIEEQRDALVKPKEEIEQLINKETLLVRPPFNTFNQNTIGIQQEYNLKIVNSSIALKSGSDVQADTIIQEFLNTKKLEGAIIGLEESQATVEALPTILENIKQSNLKVVILK